MHLGKPLGGKGEGKDGHRWQNPTPSTILAPKLAQEFGNYLTLKMPGGNATPKTASATATAPGQQNSHPQPGHLEHTRNES